MSSNIPTYNLSAFEFIRASYDPAAAPTAEQRENSRDNRHYAHKIEDIAGAIAGKKVLFLGMGQEEAAYSLARRGAWVEYGTWSEKSLDYAQKFVSPRYRDAAERIILHLIDPLSLTTATRDADIIVVMKAAKQLPENCFTDLLHRLFRTYPKAATIIHTSPNAALTGPAFAIAGVVSGPGKWKSRRYGLHEHSYFSWRRMLETLGRSHRVVMEKQNRFFSRQVLHQQGIPKMVKKLTLMADGILDSALVERLGRGRLFSPFLSTDLWALIGGCER